MKELFKVRMASIVHASGTIPPELVVGADETGIHLIPSSSYVLAKKGAKIVPRRDSDDKRQLTGMVSHSMAGNKLPLQLIFAGKTKAVLPALTDAELGGTLLSYSSSHWSTDITIVQWLKGVVQPYLARTKESLGLPADAPCLLVWDVFWAHRDVGVRKYITDHMPGLRLLYVPARCTSFLQVCDVSINKPLKSRVENKVRAWRLAERAKTGTLSRSLASLRRQTARALISVNDSLESSIILNGVRAVGLLAVWNPGEKDVLLETARACEADGSLWLPISAGDQVSLGGNPASARRFAQEDAAASEEPSVAAAQASSSPEPSVAPSPAQQQKRRREYRCGYCKETGHTVSACPRALAGLPAHPSARKSVRQRWQASPGGV